MDSLSRDVMVKLDNLTAQLITAEETLAARDEKIRELSVELDNNQETISVLNAQVSVAQNCMIDICLLCKWLKSFELQYNSSTEYSGG